MGLTFSYWVLLIPYSTIDSHAAITGIRARFDSKLQRRNFAATRHVPNVYDETSIAPVPGTTSSNAVVYRTDRSHQHNTDTST
jgi:hypothetical protein